MLPILVGKNISFAAAHCERAFTRFQNIFNNVTKKICGLKSKNQTLTGVLSAHEFSLNEIKTVILTILDIETSTLHHIYKFWFVFEARHKKVNNNKHFSRCTLAVSIRIFNNLRRSPICVTNLKIICRNFK